MEKTTVSKQSIIELFVISLISLYFELAIIRWLSSEIRIFAYFKNVPLMACLFGLGLGCALASKKDFSRWFPMSLLVVTIIISCAEPLHLVHVTFINPLENYLPGYFTSGSATDSLLSRVMFFLPGLLVLVSVFYLVVFVFSCMGQRIGRLFNEMPPLVAYSVNVLASLIGVLLFTSISFLSLTPPVWILIGAVLAIPYFRKADQILSFVLALSVAFFTMNPKSSGLRTTASALTNRYSQATQRILHSITAMPSMSTTTQWKVHTTTILKFSPRLVMRKEK